MYTHTYTYIYTCIQMYTHSICIDGTWKQDTNRTPADTHPRGWHPLNTNTTHEHDKTGVPDMPAGQVSGGCHASLCLHWGATESWVASHFVRVMTHGSVSSLWHMPPQAHSSAFIQLSSALSHAHSSAFSHAHSSAFSHATSTTVSLGLCHIHVKEVECVRSAMRHHVFGPIQRAMSSGGCNLPVDTLHPVGTLQSIPFMQPPSP